jgi:hypothetical protein
MAAKKAVASVPSYAELLSASRVKTKSSPKKKKSDDEPESASSTVDPAPIDAPVSKYTTASVPETTKPAMTPVLGCRVVLTSSGLFGTVLYVGPTSFQSGTWVGVELDSEQVS